MGTGSLAHDVNRWWHRLRGNEDPYLKIGEENDRTAKGSSEYVWALKDISFDVQQGEVLGIIGRNGAGKSTLLKILSRTTTPTKGSVKIKGRIASLLEVGTGFHPELSGRENIFLNGAILGMTKQEIKKKFDEIVDFAGVERYIDTPVKRYSSGMYVRLAFGVAAHLEPEILIVDEVLAVGDAEFQKKALGKMKNVSEQDGRTVLFVSHNMAAIKQLCSRAVILQNGIVGCDTSANEAIDFYLRENDSATRYTAADSKNSPAIFIQTAFIADRENHEKNTFSLGDEIFIIVSINIPKGQEQNLDIGLAVSDNFERRVITSFHELQKAGITNNVTTFKITAPLHLLTPGVYKFDLAVQGIANTMYDFLKSALTLEIKVAGTKYEKLNFDYGIINKEIGWEIIS